jgi:uncharacterized membrane protein
MTTLTTAVLAAATVTSGLAAGAYSLYAHTIMPGLAATNDRTFVAAFQTTNRAITNPWFLGGTFLGSLGLSAAAALLTRGEPAWPATLVAAGTAVATTVITFAVHLPLNNVITAAGDPETLPNPAQVRADFQESRWRRWNLVRVVSSLATVGSLTWALILNGRP